MDKLLLDVIWIMSILLVAYGAYYVFMALIGLTRMAHVHKPVPPEKKFLVLIAARNEAVVIGHLVDSLLRQNYPRALFEVVVVTNNCTDNTAEVAGRYGAIVLECPLPVRSKGEALAWGYENLPAGFDFDAFCIFDADNLAHPDFLRHMNHALCGGTQVAQGYRDTKNPHDSWNSGSWAINYWLGSRFYNHPHNVFRLSATILGTGFMISRPLVEQLGGLRTCTLAEDFEMTMQCIIAGVSVGWVPDAITYDEQSLTFGQTWKQRRRWQVGFLQVLSLYFGRLLHEVRTRPTRVNIDFVMYALTPVATYFSVIVFTLGVILRLVVLQYPLIPLTQIYDMFGPSLLMSLFLPMFLALLGVIFERKLTFGILKSIVAFPIFTSISVPINIVALSIYRHDFRWEEIHHTRAISIDHVDPRQKPADPVDKCPK